MMYLFGDNVRRLSNVADFVPDGVGQDYLDYVGFKAIGPEGVWGKPSQASFDKGAKLVNEMINNITGYIHQTITRLDQSSSSSDHCRLHH